MALKTHAARAFCLLAVLIVAGCVNPGQQDASRCQSYGYAPGSDGYAQCMQSAYTQRQQIIGNYLMMQAARPAPQIPQATFYPVQVQQPVRLQTMCQQIGTFTYCN